MYISTIFLDYNLARSEVKLSQSASITLFSEMYHIDFLKISNQGVSLQSRLELGKLGKPNWAIIEELNTLGLNICYELPVCVSSSMY